MVTLNAILYHSSFEGCYIAHCHELNQVITGSNDQSCINDLVSCVKECIDLSRKDETVSLVANITPPPAITEALGDTILENKSPIIKEIPGYATIHIYDFTDKEVKVN